MLRTTGVAALATMLLITAAPAANAVTDPSTGGSSAAQQNATANHSMGATLRTTPSVAPSGRSAAGSVVPAAVTAPSGLPGIDVSSSQQNFDFAGAAASGDKFAFIKATEGTPGTSPASGNVEGSVNSLSASQFAAATAAGLAVATYHYALPYYSSGPTQARFFLDHTPQFGSAAPSLPPVLDMEVATVPSKEGGDCWGLTNADMVSWIQGWVATVVAKTGVQPLIYTNQNFWHECTGDSTAFPHDRLYVAYYPTTTTNSPLMPSGFSTWTFWQWAPGTNSGPDQDVFNGTESELQALETPSGISVGRFSGADAYATAANLAAGGFTPSAAIDSNGDAPQRGTVPVVYVATRGNYPDALAGAAAAGHTGAPILLTDPNTLPDATRAELTQLQPRSIVVLGGPNAVSDTVVSQLGFYATVSRIAGSDRSQTSALIATSGAFGTGGTVYVATGYNYPDALAGAAVAGGTYRPGPILLVQPTDLTDSVRSALTTLKPSHIVILGGVNAVNGTLASDLAAYLPAGETVNNVERWSGSDRIGTSVAIAQNGFPSGATAAFVATAYNFPDALSGGPVAAAFSAPVLLTDPSSLSAATISELSALHVQGVDFLGGPNAVSAAEEAGL
ncbi:cell wall-binding repeat-containing protein [Curtobacterium ammoniigenes]|uniref:cell wall-binding repeat-containing protein n=1 Tax=Curtobacterium ammoniigenes TaxID=395387 RepID=UPI00146FE491|nr:cell wall-binding repeat-containing protein [Curtobacterium ammoniigenes]